MSINSLIWSKESQILDHNHLTVNPKLSLSVLNLPTIQSLDLPWTVRVNLSGSSSLRL